MNKTILFLLFCLCAWSADGQLWCWGKTSTSDSAANAEGLVISTDRMGNSFVTGDFTGKFNFGSYSINNPYYPYHAPYLVKYDALGNVKWAEQGVLKSSASAADGYGCAADKNGNIYLTGDYRDSVAFGSIVVKDSDYYLVKYDTNGKALWAREAAGNIESSSLTTDISNNVYVTGYFSGTIFVGRDTLQNGNIFIIKYNSNGKLIWTKAITANGTTSAYPVDAITTDSYGNVLLAGSFIDSINFSTSKSYSSGHNAFLAKFDSLGHFKWASTSKSDPYSSTVYGISVAVDKAGSGYICGTFQDSVLFGKTSLIGNPNISSYSIFLTKYDKNGNFKWAKSGVNLKNVFVWVGSGVACDTVGNVYLIGYGSGGSDYNYKINFGPDTFTTYNPSYDGSTIFVQFDTTGKLLNGTMIPAGGDDNNAVASDLTGKYVYIGGDLLNRVVFGNDTIGSTTTETPFIARWGNECNVIQTIEYVDKPVSQCVIEPNPNQGFFNIVTPNPPKDCKLEIYNVLGERIYQSKLIGDRMQINLSYAPSGIYLYRIIGSLNEFVLEGKFIIK